MTSQPSRPSHHGVPAFSVLELRNLRAHPTPLGSLIDFLQKQMTADMAPLAEGSPVLTAYANHQGRVVASGWWVPCLTDPERLWWVVPEDMNARCCELLNRFGQFEGLRAATCEGWSCSTELVTSPEASTHTVFPSWHPHTTEGWLQLNSACGLRVREHTTSPTPPDGAWVDACLSAGWVVVGATLSERFTPSMLNYHRWNAVCLTKGCFLGQEVIARVHHLGQTKRTLHRSDVTISPPPAPCTPVERDGQTVGQVLYAGPTVMLGILPRPRGDAPSQSIPSTCVNGHTVHWHPVTDG